MNEISQDYSVSICEKALEMKSVAEVAFLELGKLLFEIKANRYFESSYESWGEFLMEMRMSQSTASKIMTIYSTFILQYDISPRKIAEAGGYTVVYDLVPLVTDKESAEHWLDQAQSMTRSDIKKEAMLARNLPEPEDCEHEWGQTCKKCNMIYE